MNDFFDLQNPNYAYMLGLFQTDGSLSASTRNRGKFVIEMDISNKNLLEQISKYIPYNTTIGERIRTTNYKKDAHSVFLRVCNLEFRNIINKSGVPYGKKSNIIEPPMVEYSKPDYYRGIIDGDGSIGFTNNEFPFISLTTASQKLYNAYISYIYEITGCKKVNNPNKRDNIYNIMLSRESAQDFSKVIYYPNCELYSERKMKNSLIVSEWKRPFDNKINHIRKLWEPWEDEVILYSSIEDSMKKLNRTKQSISIRLWTIKKHKSNK